MKFKQMLIGVLMVLALFSITVIMPVQILAQTDGAVVPNPVDQGALPTELPKVIAFIITFLIPFISEKLKKLNWVSTGNGRFWVTTGIAVVVGVVATITSGIHLTFLNLFLWITVAFTYATLAYRAVIQHFEK